MVGAGDRRRGMDGDDIWLGLYSSLASPRRNLEMRNKEERFVDWLLDLPGAEFPYFRQQRKLMGCVRCGRVSPKNDPHFFPPMGMCKGCANDSDAEDARFDEKRRDYDPFN